MKAKTHMIKTLKAFKSILLLKKSPPPPVLRCRNPTYCPDTTPHQAHLQNIAPPHQNYHKAKSIAKLKYCQPEVVQQQLAILN